MYIKAMKIQNFKSFKGALPWFEFTTGINYIVGNNNAGKTTIFKALEFLIHGGNKSEVLCNSCENNEDVMVEVLIDGVSESQEASLKKYNKYINNGELRLKRSSKEETIEQNGKNVTLTIRKIQIWNETKQQYENPTGFDTAIRKLIDISPIYADMHNEDYQDFGTTKITGKIVRAVTQNFQKSEDYLTLKENYQRVFGKEGIQRYLDDTETLLSNLITDQFGNSKVNFSFEFPEVNSLLKQGQINVTENNSTTSLAEKGNGLQRALALALIQVYADMNAKDDNSPYFIDEPEIYLHPLAQDKLLNSFKKLASEGNQIFITTHSPYIIRHFNSKKDSLIIIKMNKNCQKNIQYQNELLFSNPSIGEISYVAFGVPTVDFHQRLFTKIYIHWVMNRDTKVKATIPKFEEEYLKRLTYISSNHPFIERYVDTINPSKKKSVENGGWVPKENHTLPYIIRNEVDHPEVLEQGKNTWDEENLRQSIEDMLQIIKNENIQ